MLTARWKNQEVPLLHDSAGIFCTSGEAYEVKGNGLLMLTREPKISCWINVAVLAQQELYGGDFVVKCGEAIEHGSIGVIVLESKKTGEAIWSFSSSTTNPFDQISVKGGSVLVLSTSGAVLRFRTPLNEVTLLDA